VKIPVSINPNGIDILSLLAPKNTDAIPAMAAEAPNAVIQSIVPKEKRRTLSNIPDINQVHSYKLDHLILLFIIN